MKIGELMGLRMILILAEGMVGIARLLRLLCQRVSRYATPPFVLGEDPLNPPYQLDLG